MSRYSVGTSRMAAADRFVLLFAAFPALGLLVTSSSSAAVVVGLLALVLVGALLIRRVMRSLR